MTARSAALALGVPNDPAVGLRSDSTKSRLAMAIARARSEHQLLGRARNSCAYIAQLGQLLLGLERVLAGAVERGTRSSSSTRARPT